MSEPWRPKRNEWCSISFDLLSGRPKPDPPLFGFILGLSKQTDSFIDGSDRQSFLSGITPGEVWKILTSDGQVGHWHYTHLRELKRPKASK